MTSAPPSINFADLGTLGGTFRSILKKWLQRDIDGMLPAVIVAVDHARKIVTVQPQIKLVDTLGNVTSRAQIQNLPIFTLGAGNFVLTWPVKAGDFGWIIANDRDISLYVKSQSEQPPNTARLHSFSDAVFFPDKGRQWALADEDADRSTWQSLDGTAKIALGTDEIKILHPTLVEIAVPHVTVPSGDLKVDKGIGFFNTSPPGSQPSVTGHLSAVADTNAKAVLTSIIAVLTGCGEAKDGTT